MKANAQKPVQVSYSKATKAGVGTCPAKYRATRAVKRRVGVKMRTVIPAFTASFQHGLTGICYSCPAGHKRSLNPNIKAKDACVRGLPGRTANSKATYRGKVKAKKPKGTFFDPRKGGEYWSCRRGTHRTVFAVTSNKACERRAKTHYSKASKYRKNSSVGQGCPRGKFWDVIGGEWGLGACYSCPGGYRRSASSVTSSKACYRTVKLARYKAKRHGSVKNPKPRGAFLDPRKGGEYWSCPASYKRSVVAVTAKNACVRVILPRTLKAKATPRGRKGCPRGSFQNGAYPECYRCPKGYKRSLAIGRDLSKMRNACVKVKVDLSGGARALAWMKRDIAKIRRQVEPEIAAATNVMRRNHKLVQALLKAKTDTHRAAIALRIAESAAATMRKRKRASLDDIDQRQNQYGPRIQLASAGKIPAQLALIPKNVIFQTVSVAIVADASFGVGATLTPVMVALPIAQSRKRVFHYYNAVAGSAGLSVGADGSGEVGLWVDDYKSLAGGSMGGAAGVTLGVGGSLTFWWSTDPPHKYLGMTFTIGTGVGAEIKFTAGNTWLRKDLNDRANQR